MIETLQQMPYFQHIKVELLEELIKNQKIIKKDYLKYETIYEQGEKCKGIDLILSGKLIAYSLTSKGSETSVFDFIEEDTVGANLLFGNSNMYPLNIYCGEKAVVIHIVKSAVVTLLKEHHFSMEFIKVLSSNSQGLNKKIAIYTNKSLRENLKDYLSAQSVMQKSSTVYLPISKKQLADFLGVQRPSLFRELKKMKEEGIIKIDNRTIVLLF